MAEPVGDANRREPHLDQQGDVAVPEVVDAYPFDMRALAAAIERVMELGLGEGEDARVGIEGEGFDPLPQLVLEELLHDDFAY